MYINDVNSQYYLQSNRILQYLFIEYIVGGSLIEENAKRRNDL